MDVPIIRPRIVNLARNQNLQVLLGGEKGFSEGANVLFDSAFVYIDTNGALASSITIGAGPVASGAGTLFIGFNPKSRSGATKLDPPYVMAGGTTPPPAGSTGFQPNYWPHDLKGLRFAMNLTLATFQIGQANGAPTLSHANCIIGKEVSLIVGGTSTPTPAGVYAGVYAIDISDVTNPDVKIVDIPKRFGTINQSDPTTAYNGIVIVEFLTTKLQSQA